jgi:hypothetical protein
MDNNAVFLFYAFNYPTSYVELFAKRKTAAKLFVHSSAWDVFDPGAVTVGRQNLEVRDAQDIVKLLKPGDEDCLRDLAEDIKSSWIWVKMGGGAKGSLGRRTILRREPLRRNEGSAVGYELD